MASLFTEAGAIARLYTDREILPMLEDCVTSAQSRILLYQYVIGHDGFNNEVEYGEGERLRGPGHTRLWQLQRQLLYSSA